MRRCLVILVLLALFHSANAQGWGDWSRQTPGGSNVLRDNGGGVELQTANRTLDGVRNWYFYRGHIVGQARQGYFVLHERVRPNTMQLYPTAEKWQRSLDNRMLRPHLWLRVYNDDWVTLAYVPWLFILYWPLALLGIGILLFIGYKTRRKAAKPVVICGLIIGVALLVRLTLDYYPYSL